MDVDDAPNHVRRELPTRPELTGTRVSEVAMRRMLVEGNVNAFVTLRWQGEEHRNVTNVETASTKRAKQSDDINNNVSIR